MLSRNGRLPALALSLALGIGGCGGEVQPSEPDSTQAQEEPSLTVKPLSIPGTTAVTAPTVHCVKRIGKFCWRWAPDGHVQSETSATVQTFSNQTVITVAFNDDYGADDGIQYTATTRHILHGASMMGWAYSLDLGKNWTRGHISTPPKGIAALWGDPAITSSRENQSYVFLSNLMVPDYKFPSSVGYIDGLVDAYLGGACIARSSDAGKTFSVSASDCVSNNGAFYDGGSMTSDNNHAVYGAWANVDQSAIDVWRADNETAPFHMLANPFPGISIATHPRMHFDPLNNYVYVLAQGSDSNLWANRYDGNSWGSPVILDRNTAVYPAISFSDRTVRTGPQFAFDIGNPASFDTDVLRYCVTHPRGDGTYYIQCGSVAPDLSVGSIQFHQEWTTIYDSGSQFNPSVAQEPFVFGLPSVWKSSWMSSQSDPNGNTVQVMQTTFADGVWNPSVLAGSQIPCSDTRSTGGNWTDYDDLKVAYVDSNGNPWFIKFLADSSGGACTRWTYYGSPVHVSAVVFQ